MQRTPDFEQVVVFSVSTAQLFQLVLVGLCRRHVALQECLLGAAALVKQAFHLGPVARHHLSPLLHRTGLVKTCCTALAGETVWQ